MLTLKQEKFAQLVITEPSYSAAYRKAYNATGMTYGSVNSCATALLKNIKIASRVSELRAATSLKFDITRDSILDELEYARQVAIEEKQPAAMTAATMSKARIMGLDKIIVSGDQTQPISLIKRVIVG